MLVKRGAVPRMHHYDLCTLHVCSGALHTVGGQHTAAGIHCWHYYKGDTFWAGLNIEKIIINIKACMLRMNESNIYIYLNNTAELH